LSIFPEALRGIVSTKSTDFGALKFAMRVRAQAMISAASRGAPRFKTTIAFTDSPQASSGTPITATSAIAE
jgi:hypothetical protein